MSTEIAGASERELQDLDKRIRLIDWQREKESTLRRALRSDLTKLALAGDGEGIARVTSEALIAGAADGYAKAVYGEHPFRTPQAWALRDVYEMAGAIGQREDMADKILKALGVASLMQAKTSVRAVQVIESMTDEEIDAEAADRLRSRGWAVAAPGDTNGAVHGV